jgi:hypothetical protein
MIDLLDQETIGILGCIELSLVFPKNYSLLVLDFLEILARALLKRYYQGEAV